MIDLTDLIAEKRELIVKFPSGSLKVHYRPSVLTPEYFNKLQTQMDDASNSEKQEISIQNICNIVVSWDLADNGVPVPITAEALSKIPQVILTAVFNEVEKDQGKLSGATTSTGGSRGRS